MTTRRPDMYLIALLEFWEIIPSGLAEALVGWYDTPQPVNYDTAREFVHEKFHEFVDGLDIEVDEDASVPALPPGTSNHGRPGAEPPDWFKAAHVSAYAEWLGLSRVEPEEC